MRNTKIMRHIGSILYEFILCHFLPAVHLITIGNSTLQESYIISAYRQKLCQNGSVTLSCKPIKNLLHPSVIQYKNDKNVHPFHVNNGYKFSFVTERLSNSVPVDLFRMYVHISYCIVLLISTYFKSAFKLLSLVVKIVFESLM